MRCRLLFLIPFLTFYIISTAQFQTNGTAVETLVDTCYRLTSASNSQAGSVWNTNQVDLSEDFEIVANMFLGANDGGADGMVFAFQQVSSSAGTLGGGMGIQGIQPSLFIQFDTYQNGNAGDPWYDHASINRNGDISHTTANNLDGPVQISATATNVEDNQNHLVLIRWLVNTNGTQTLEMYFDCSLRLTHTDDFINTIFNGNPNVFWGFTAATGALNNQHSFCFEYVSVLETNLGNQDVCIGDSVEITAPSFGSSYTWSPAAGLSNPNIRNPIASPDVTTTYNVVINNVCNVPLQDSLTVFVLDTSSFTIDTSICEGDSYLAGGQFQTISGQYYDTLVNNLGCDSILTTNLTVLDTSVTIINDTICNGDVYMFGAQNLTMAGTYVDVLTNQNNCDSTVTLNLEVYPVSNTNIDTTICQGDAFVFNGNTIQTAGVYLDTLISALGCDSFVELTVFVDDVATEQNSYSICNGDSILLGGDWQFTAGTYFDTLRYAVSQCDSVQITSSLTIIDTVYTYVDTTICEGDSLFFDDYYVDQAGTYRDTLLIPGECPIVITLTVTTFPVPNVMIMGDSTFCVEDSLELIAVTSSPQVVWLPVNSNSNPLIVNEGGRYIVQAFDNEGCVGSDTIDVTALSNCYILLMPTAFSPNGDGVNDVFGPVNYPNSFFEMSIYNRFGELIFISNDPTFGWDGTFKGKDVEIGVYSFYINYKFEPNHQEKELKGSLTVIR